VTISRAVFLAGSAALAASGGSPALAQAPRGIPIRVASTASDSYAGALYAHDQGFFERAGLAADVQILASGAAITAAVAAKAVDIGITNAIPLIAGVQRGVPFRYICSGGLVNYDEFGMCVATNSAITTWKDLEGKTVAASSLNDIAVLALRALVDQQGGDSTKVHLLEVPFSQMAAFIRRGTVDAGPIAEPALSAAQKEGGIRVLQPAIFSAFGPRFMVGGWFALDDWISANRTTAHRFVGAIYEAAAWANSHPDESTAILAKYSKVDVSILRSMNRSPLGTTLTPDMLQSVLDLSYKYKFNDRPIKAAEIIAKL
jgi:NitT/TauT family transport system substrate-binding protein